MYLNNQTPEEIAALKALEGKGGKFGVEVIADGSGKFCGNGVRKDTVQEAANYGDDLTSRWMLVREWRIVHFPE